MMAKPRASSVPIIHAEPSKSFFIDMLTRDIGIADCVCDLIDNAIDKAVSREKINVMEVLERGEARSTLTHPARVTIRFTKTEFIIEDTCGGISIAEAANEVFLLGNPEERRAAMGLSVYGIGMKRAMFKLGRTIHVDSWTSTEHFRVDIDVDKWERLPNDWTLKFTSAGANTRGHAPGTRIRVVDLNAGVRERLGQQTFENDLRATVSQAYALFLRAGIRITVNGAPLAPALPKLGVGTFKPARRKVKYSNVEVLIIAGVSPRDDKSSHGWYVFCNGRMVVAGDKTSLTGWGDRPAMPQFHSKYNHFIGFVYFGSPDVAALPWRTTKQGVDRESPVFQRALAEMKVEARPVLNYLNKLYPDDAVPAEAERSALDDAVAMDLEDLPPKDSAFKVNRKPRKTTEFVKIQYSRPRAQVDAIRRHVGDRTMSAVKVGEYTFDYFVEQELG